MPASLKPVKTLKDLLNHSGQTKLAFSRYSAPCREVQNPNSQNPASQYSKTFLPGPGRRQVQGSAYSQANGTFFRYLSSKQQLRTCKSMDGKLLCLFSQVWDARKFKAPVKTFDDLPNYYGQTNVTFSPDEQLILTGTSYEKGEDAPGGQIVFFDRERLELVRKVGIAPTQSVVRVLWHPRLNQVCNVLFDSLVKFIC
jgi:hypothetical protein